MSRSLFLVLLAASLAENALGTVTLRTCTPAPTVDMVINYGDDISCAVDPGSAIDFFRFQGTAGERVMIILTGTAASTLFCFSLYSPQAAQLDSACDAPFVGRDFALPSTGLYTIRVYNYSFTVSFTFHLYLERWYPPLPALPVTAYGQVLQGSLQFGPQDDVWVFAGSAGDSIAVQLTITSNDRLLACFDLYQPSLDLLDFRCDAPVARGEYVLPTTGMYLARVHDYGRSATFSYTFYTQCLGTCTLGTLGLPLLNLNLTGCTTCNNGNTFSARLTASNVANKTTELKLGFYLPDGTTGAAGNPHLEFPPEFTFDGEVLRGPIVAAHPRGSWRLCARLIELAVGEILAASCQPFTIQ